MTNRSGTVALAGALALLLPYSYGPFAQGTAKAVLTPAADLKWIGAGVPGVETAVVKGTWRRAPASST